jgi:hypothetical protein
MQRKLLCFPGCLFHSQMACIKEVYSLALWDLTPNPANYLIALGSYLSIKESEIHFNTEQEKSEVKSKCLIAQLL